MLADIVKFSKKLTLWRLDKVIRKWLKFREIGQDPNKNTNNLFVLEDIKFLKFVRFWDKREAN